MTHHGALEHARTNEHWAIDLSDVAKTYKGNIEALKGISMQVQHGEVFGLLGPNGAGKSTLVKILMTIIKPTRCTGTVLGKAVGSKECLRQVGYLPEHHRFPDYLTGAQVLDFYAAMGKVPRRIRKARIGELLDLVGMGDWGNTKVSKYSKGMRQRVGIAQALMNDPEIVLLDEPTDGVDPVGRRDIRNILAHLKDQGKTVFLNSHLLSELEMVCDRVAILVHGQVAQQGTIDELTAGKERYEIQVQWRDDDADEMKPGDCGSLLTSVLHKESDSLVTESGAWVKCEKDMIQVGTTDPKAVQPILDALRSRQVVIRSLKPVRPSLEELFMQAVSDAGDEHRAGAKRNHKTTRKGRKRKDKRAPGTTTGTFDERSRS